MTRRSDAKLWTRPLRVHLGAVFVALLAATAAPLLWISYEGGRRAAIEAVLLEMDTLAERIVDHYHISFADKLALVQLGSALEEMATPPPAALEAKRRYMFEVLALAPNLDGIFAGYPDGRFLRMVSLREGSPWRVPIEAPDSAVAALEMIIPDADGAPTVRWTFLGADGRPVGFIAVAPTDFDPRMRPWYQAAVQKGDIVATEPYLMPISGAYVKTVADPHKSDPGVVVAADVLLETVADFLNEERMSPGATNYVFDNDGDLVVHSDSALMGELVAAAREGESVDQAHLFDDDPLLAHVLDRLRAVRSGVAQFSFGGETYHALFVPVDFVSILQGYTITIVAPESDFTGDVEAALYRGLLTALAVLAVGMLAAVLISRLISRSLAGLTADARRLQALDFTEAAPVRSRIAEIVDLGVAMASARAAISSFSLYVPKELVRRIVASGLFDRHAAAREVVTVMFTDIKDFTTISEHNEPEAVVAMLSDYFELMNAGVEESGGTIVQFIGDAVHALWNAPVAQPDHAEQACLCAMRLAAALDAFNAGCRAAGKPELVTRFGIHTGPAVVGNVGGRERLQYTAIGDTINVASRLEGLNKELGTTILTSRETREACAGRLVFAAHGQIRVKGRSEPVEVYEPKAAAVHDSEGEVTA